MPGDASAVEGVSLSRPTLRRIWTFARPYRRLLAVYLARHPRRRPARPRAAAHRPGDHRHGDPQRRPHDDHVARRARCRRRRRRRRAQRACNAVQRVHRRVVDLRPAIGAVHQGDPHADRLLHPDADRGDHVAPQQRRRRRPDRRHQHPRQRRQQRHRAGHLAGRDAHPRLAPDAARPRRASAVRHPGPPCRSSAAGHLPPADAAQRGDEHADDRALQRRRSAPRQAVRRRPPRAGVVPDARRRRARRRHPPGAVRARVLRRPRPRRGDRRGGDLRRRRPARRVREHHHRNARRPGGAGDPRLHTADGVDQRTRRPDDVDGQLRAGLRGARRTGGDRRAARRRRPPESPRGPGRRITFDAVRFRYPPAAATSVPSLEQRTPDTDPDRDVLDGIDLDIAARRDDRPRRGVRGRQVDAGRR